VIPAVYSSKESNIVEDIHNPHNGGNRLREENRADKHQHSKQQQHGKEKDDEQSDRHNGKHHLNGELTNTHPHTQDNQLLTQKEKRDITGLSSSSSSSWFWSITLLLLLLSGCGVAVYSLYHRYSMYTSYLPIKQVDSVQVDAYSDLLEDDDEELNFSNYSHTRQQETQHGRLF